MKTGVIGLGAMGYGMAANLHKAGHLCSIFNRTTTVSDRFAEEHGIAAAENIAALAQACDLIITCVSRDQDVIEVIEKIAGSVNRDSIIVDTSTVSSETARKASEILATAGAFFLDAPVSGGVEGARKGTLAMMVGGDPGVLDRARPVLSAMAANIIHIGPTGSGQACKAVNQLMCAGINQAVTESLAFGATMQLDMDKVVDVVSSGAAGNWFVAHRGKTMLAGKYDAGFKVNLHHKDLEIIRGMIDGLDGVQMPLGEMTLGHYEKLMAAGHGDEDISALYRLKQPGS